MMDNFLKISFNSMVFVSLCLVEVNAVKSVKTEFVYNVTSSRSLLMEYCANLPGRMETCLKQNIFPIFSIYVFIGTTVLCSAKSVKTEHVYMEGILSVGQEMADGTSLFKE